jgi:hypothetical protein
VAGEFKIFTNVNSTIVIPRINRSPIRPILKFGDGSRESNEFDPEFAPGVPHGEPGGMRRLRMECLAGMWRG